MPTVLQFRRGNSTQNDAFTGAAGELTIDTTEKTIRIHDGTAAGGSSLIPANTSGLMSDDYLANTGVTAGTYGNSSVIPTFTVDVKGRLTTVSEVNVAGVTNFTYNSSSEVLTISTADGGSFSANIAELADETYVDTAIANLVDTAPATLDTLNELAAALGDDPNFATTITTTINNKAANAYSNAVSYTDANVIRVYDSANTQVFP